MAISNVMWHPTGEWDLVGKVVVPHLLNFILVIAAYEWDNDWKASWGSTTQEYWYYGQMAGALLTMFAAPVYHSIVFNEVTNEIDTTNAYVTSMFFQIAVGFLTVWAGVYVATIWQSGNVQYLGFSNVVTTLLANMWGFEVASHVYFSACELIGCIPLSGFFGPNPVNYG